MLASALLAACGSTSVTEVSAPTDSRCRPTVTATPASMPADGGSVTIAVATTRDCEWTSGTEASWIRLSATTGQGEATFTANVDANPQITSRSGTVIVNSQRASIVQAGRPCTFDLDANAASFGASGGSGRIEVMTIDGCSWQPASTQPWLQVPAASRTGTGAIAFDVAPNDGAARTGVITIADARFVVTQAAVDAPGPAPLPDCVATVSPATLDVAAAASTQAIQVVIGSGCPWSAASTAPWLTLAPSSASGTGRAMVSVTVAANAGSARTGTLTIAGQQVTVRQAALSCAYTLSPTSQSFSAAGGNGRFRVTTPSACGWTASVSAPWITLSKTNGTGSGDVGVTVQANDTPASRSGSITVAGQTFTVSQAALACTATMNPASQSVPAAGGSFRFAVAMPAGCNWSASRSVPWIEITAGTGTGTGDVTFTVQANQETAARNGAIAVAGQTFPVSQAGVACSYAVSPASASLPAAGGGGQFTVTSQVGCAWTASADAAWVAVNTPSNGAGSGTADVVFTIQPNPDPAPRSTTISVGGQSFAVNQAAAAVVCSYTLSPPTASLPAAGGMGQFTVTTQPGCAWTVTAGAAWMAIAAPEGGNGIGTGDVVYNVQPNPDGTPRAAGVTVGGQTHSVNQAAATPPPPPPCTYALNPASGEFPAAGATGAFTVTTQAGCAWTATTAEMWISLTGASGSSTAEATFTVQPNTTGMARVGTITVSGQTYTVSQVP